MPPKHKEMAKKAILQVNRPAISDSTLLYVPSNAIEGYQERIETGIDWTLVELAARHHRQLCLRGNITKVTFTEALQNKINKSILKAFLNEQSNLSLEEQWELLLPITLWDNEKFANEESKICFRSYNNITDDMVKLIKRAVQLGDRKVLRQELKLVPVLRLNDAQLTELDSGLLEFQKLVTLNLCGNFLNDFDSSCIPRGVKILELQANCIRNIKTFSEYLPSNLSYLGLARNLLNDDNIESLLSIPNITVLDLSDNDIYNLEEILNILVRLPNLSALFLAGNPCSVCSGYARTTLTRLPRLKWLDSREILLTNRPIDPFEPHPNDLRSTYFNFTIFRIMSAPQPPKPEKGAITTFHVELELPLLDTTRRNFLMFRQNESLIERLPLPEDEEWPVSNTTSKVIDSKIAIDSEASAHDSDIYKCLTTKNSREIYHFTTFESNRIQWNKVMNFQEPAVRIFCPDLFALRNTFRTVVTIRLIYSMTMTSKQNKPEKKSAHSLKQAVEQRVTLATIKCSLRRPDWSQNSQHFHWDNSLGTNEAIHWGEGDLSVLQYSQAPVKITKGKTETDVGSLKQQIPENLTCHFGFGIDTLRI
ncbi:uncharacterized protein LOC113517096 isoform X1 [Galleria mellonella]|uniref:Uncharacterized protein LOC113517096 isoform X1 n=1 Tax=Galleria mellonella TaxID=7137 RepID=A0A6J1WXH2_GALME|nr:uncharacterized protein LOC113517096 isoform X1 [Galleria mellonella]